MPRSLKPKFLPFWSLALVASTLIARAADNTGLWVGEVVLDRVNEVVVSFDAQNRRVATPPQTLTPTSDKASLRLILHVDEAGNVRLLKGVAIINQPVADGPPETILLTDPQRFPDFPVPARRIASVAFEFGDETADLTILEVGQAIADHAADSVNTAAAPLTSLEFEQAVDAAAAAGEATIAEFRSGERYLTLAVQSALTAGIEAKSQLPADPSTADITDAVQPPVWQAAFNSLGRFTLISQGASLAEAITTEIVNKLLTDDVQPSGFDGTVAAVLAELAPEFGALTSAVNNNALSVYSFGDALAKVPTGTARAALEAATLEATAFGSNEESIRDAARSAVLASSELRSARRFAQQATLPDLPAGGRLLPGNSVEASFYLGPNHPINPFRHRRHPDHTEGIPIRRQVVIEIDEVDAGTPGTFSAPRMTGTYTEEFFGTHKPLGADKNIGLRTAGNFTLFRIDQTGSLNP